MVEAWAAKQVCEMTGITYKKLDYWARTGLIIPSVAEAGGTGTMRAYNREDVLLLAWIVQMLDQGWALWYIRAMVEGMRRMIAKGGGAIEQISNCPPASRIKWLPSVGEMALKKGRY